ncbi:MAG: hypothetical protein J1F40_08835 [Prevotellaceae bacterium]|nr:hypothetical protein [Prevotellaceae bacterium]
MKIKAIPTVIALLLAAILSFLFYLLSNAEAEMLKALALSTFVTVGISLVCGIGVAFKDSQHSVSATAISMLFVIIFIAEHCCFSIWGTSRAWLAVTSGALLAVYLLIYYGISKAKM